MARSPHLDEILGLDPRKDHQRIVFLCSCHEFAFDMVRSLEFALFRTFCVPSISALLDRTGEFANRAQKRYDDTDLIVSELMAWGYESERGSAALARMNAIHSRFPIANRDYLYVLSTFIFEPIRWIDRHGWRPLCEQERLGIFHFWREVGRRMNIREIPEDYHAFERYNVEYERDHFRHRDSNTRVGGATRDMFLSWGPRFLRPLARPAMYALMDEPLLDAFGFPKPSRWARRLVAGALSIRARLLRLAPPRRRPRIRTELRHRTYPRGYRIDELGPPSMIEVAGHPRQQQPAGGGAGRPDGHEGPE